MRCHALFSAAAVWLAFAAAQTITGCDAKCQAACDAGCQATFGRALATEKSNWATQDFANDPFFTTPANATGARPGDILRWQEIPAAAMRTNFTAVPPGMSLTRFMYVTEDIDRKPIPATAFALLPLSLPESGVFKTTVWTHGTAGRSRHCAPSNQKNLYYGWQAPFLLAAGGHAVIAPDYSGQGSDVPGGFRYEAGHIHAADAAYSLVAARKVMGAYLSKEWVVIGHSEGGMTAWRTNQRLAMSEQEALNEAGTFIGAVSIAPAMTPVDLIPKSFRLAGDKPNGPAQNALYMLQSLAAMWPKEFNMSNILTDRANAVLPLLDSGCQDSGQVLLANMTTKDVFKSTEWISHPKFLEWQRVFNGVDERPLAAPMLIIQGDNDQLTYLEEALQSFNRTCNGSGAHDAEMRIYPDLGHGGALDASADYFMPWIADRFANAATAQKGCFVTKPKPVNTRYQRG
ncbi:hypothetical protein RB595_005612 [Gaeumannomyces hyphopodioides]